MSWNWADVLVLVLCAAQVGLLVAIVVALLRIKNGPLARLADSASSLADSAKTLAEAGQGAVEKSQGHVLGIVGSAARIAAALKPLPEPEGLQVRYADLRRWYSAALSLRGTLTQIEQVLRRPAASVPPPGPPSASGATGPARPATHPRGLADRLGLVPPIFYRVAPLLGAARIALRAYRAVQAQRRQTPPTL